MLKDQLARIFRYADSAEQEILDGPVDMFTGRKQVRHKIIIGFQFAGIASESRNTRQNPEIFENDHYFRVVEQCPICETGRLERGHKRDGVTHLRCDNQTCRAEFHVSISKQDHLQAQPHILVTTVESLDGLYLTPNADFENYLRSLTGIVFDEVHLYESLYGVHIFHLIQSIENLRGRNPLAKIAASATISSPNRFIAKLFYGDETQAVTVHQPNRAEMILDGLEVVYFLQSPDEDNIASASTLIQTVMVVGHGLLTANQRGIVFTESVDMAHRLQAQIQDAESSNGGLWRFRTVLDDIIYQGNRCPRTNPIQCINLYQNGECWRGLIGGQGCTVIPNIREVPINVTCVSSRSRGNFWDPNMQIITATSALEVGVDDNRIQTTFHYRPPRTVFSFIQRRGRAGRRTGDIAYTFMVLGNDSADQFYFFRRNRLFAENYELPLNPQNLIVQEMHRVLNTARQRMQVHVARSGSERGIFAWILETLRQCPVVLQYYENEINGIQAQASPAIQKNRFLRWITNEVNRFNSYLNLRWTLNQIEEASPDHLRDNVNRVRILIDDYLQGQQDNADTIQQNILDIHNELGRLRLQEQNDNVMDNLRTLQDSLVEVWHSFRGQIRFELEPQLAEGFHDFFRALNKFNDPDKRNWVLNYAPDVLKTILQSFFYLNLATQDLPNHHNCLSCIPYFVPDTYFQQVKPLIVEVRTTRPTDEPRLEQENITSLSSLFLPYRVTYRYHNHPYLSTIDTEHDPDLVRQQNGQTIVSLRLRGEGIQRGNNFYPRKIYVRSIRGDNPGDGIFKLCPSCYALYSENRQRPCHEQALISIKVYATPVIQRESQVTRFQRITRTFDFIEIMEGSTTVLGSDVEAHPQVWTGERYIRNPGVPRLEFQARYRERVVYSLPTKGIRWNLDNLVECVLQNNQLCQQIEQLPIPKILGRELVLHTAAHMLYKAIAAISGVNEEVLEYAINYDDNSILVWERYEGGAGISEIIRDSLRNNPAGFYRELLASAICPVNLAEQEWWHTSDELQRYLTQEWLLPTDDELSSSIIQETLSERRDRDNLRRRQEEVQPTCSLNDGCPVCLRITYCIAEREQRDHVVSHFVAEAIIRCLIRHIPHDELDQLINENLAEDLMPPMMLYANPTTGESSVLLL